MGDRRNNHHTFFIKHGHNMFWLLLLSCKALYCNGFAATHKKQHQRQRQSPPIFSNRRCSSLQALVYDNSMHTALSYLMPSSSSSTTSSVTNSFADWNPPNNDIVTNWLKSSATVDIFSDVLTTPDVDFIESNNILSTESASTILATSSDRSLTNDEVATLQRAFAEFYGTPKNVQEAYELLTKCINIWKETEQGGDEIAGLYRVRGDVNMELFQPSEAVEDYTKSIQYLEGVDGYKADPEELPASRLGRARAIRSMGTSATISQALQASKDYETYFIMTSNIGGDDSSVASTKSDETISFSEVIIDGMNSNPYAAWEWGLVNRVAQQYDTAAEIHRLASNAFGDIGDKPRKVICALDRGIDMACGLGDGKDDDKKLTLAKNTLEEEIENDVNVEGRDVALLQRLVVKEGEARLALSGVLWGSNSKGAAEAQYGTACSRLDELNADYQRREQLNEGRSPPMRPSGVGLGYSIDDIVGADDASCSRFKNDKFIEKKLVWSEPLQMKVKKFLTLSQ